MKRILLMLLATVSLVACDEIGGETSPKSIVVQNEQQLTQTVYADDNAGSSGVTFNTTGAWTSEITETTKERSTVATAPNWVSISPSSGDKAGEYTITISMNNNYVGSDRTATIKLLCDGHEIILSITQKGTTADGSKPEKPVSSKIVSKINGEAVTYYNGIIKQLGEKEYISKWYENNTWYYISDYYFYYDDNILSSVKYNNNKLTCNLQWAGQNGLYIYGDQRGVSREGYLHTHVIYGDIDYTLGNIDINWLLASSEYYTIPDISAVGIRTFNITRLISVKNQTDDDGKYNAEITYRYEFDQEGYIIKIYENSTLSGERLIYEFEYTNQ